MNKITLLNMQVNRSQLLIVTSVLFCFLLVSLRVAFSRELSYLFLLWNLFLAWIPLGLVNHLQNVSDKRRIKRIVVMLLWLAFLPNSPYILTDLFHLRKLESSPFWYDWLLLISFGWTGLLLGFLALRRMEIEVKKLLQHKGRFGLMLQSIFVPGMLLLSAYGVYLGRYQRTNSWEIITNPFGVITDIVSSLQTPRAWGISLLFGSFLLLVWHGIQILGQTSQIEDHDERS
jgi:uncharacterized membrane protein